jgi:hypothetical protein
LEKEREGIEEGARVEKWRGQGVFGQMAISFIPLDSEQRGGGGGGGDRAGWPAAIGGDPVLDEGRKMGQNGEDGNEFDSPT